MTLQSNAHAYCDVQGYERAHLRADVERLQGLADDLAAALRQAKVGLVASLSHQLNTCNEGMEQRCFVCDGLNAVLPALARFDSTRQQPT